MLKKLLVTAITGIGLTLALSATVSAQEATPETQPDAPQTGYAPVNGLELYYEIHGTADQAIILLHGGLGSTDMFDSIIPTLAQTRRVIAVDLQAHGRTADIDRPLTYEAMADDIAALVDYLELESVEILGYSLGGGVAIQTAIRHPEIVSKLVLVSTVFRLDGWYPEVLAGMTAMNAEAAQGMLETPMYQLYSSVAPNPENWSGLVGKLGTLLSTDYDWTTDVSALQMPILIVIGDADSVRLDHAVEMFGLFGGGQVDGGFGGLPRAQFAVLPNGIHWMMPMHPALLTVVTPFLNPPAMPAM